MRRRSRLMLTGVILICTAVPMLAGAESVTTVFDAANNAFWNGDYAQAAKHYKKLEELGVRDASLSYNLGTAYARMGKLGRAVQHYERALRLAPGHPDTQHNLGALRDFLARRASEAGRDADLAPAVTAWRAILDRFSPTSAGVAFVLFYAALFVVLIGRRFTAGELPRLSHGVLTGILAVLTVATLSVTAGKWHQETFVHEAVVIVNNRLDVMEGPASKVKRFSIEEGSRVRVIESKEAWLRLRDGEGRDGWAPSDSLGQI